MSRVVIIARRAEALPFKAAGVEIIEAADAEAAGAALDEMRGETRPCLAMMPEDFAARCEEAIARFRAGKLRAVVALPSLAQPPGLQREKVRALVARALGVDKLGRQEA